MPIVIPEKTEDSIGIVKTDDLPEGVTPDQRYYTTATQLERMKDLLIALAGEVGETAAPDPASLLARVVELESGSALDPIWEWDGVGTTQFTGVGLVDVSGSTNKAGSGTLAVAADPIEPGTNILRMTGTGLRGAYLWRINDLPDPLPRKLRVEWCWCDAQATLANEAWIIAAMNLAGTQGLAWSKPFSSGGTANGLQRIVNGETVSSSGTSITSGGAAASTTEARRRHPASGTVMRPSGTPAHWQVWHRAEGGPEGGRTSQELTPDASWNGLTFGELGIAIYRAGIAADVGAHELKYLRIYDAT
jgi:hypothetical protein